QGQLAELSDIHPVSIRKYETNKMQPQPSQIEKIATALNVSYTAINGVSNNGLRLDTIGDLMGFLMVMCDAGIIQVKGNRNKDGSIIKDSFKLIFNPILNDFIGLSSNNTNISIEDIIIKLKNKQILDDFLKWEQLKYNYMLSVMHATERDIPKLEEYLAIKNAVELELQSSLKRL
ncbi:MAG: helix-turn-helix domain-containing protein, partial [Lachnospirales bacterium]